MLSFSNVSIINYNIFAAFCVCVFKRYIYENIRSIYELNIIKVLRAVFIVSGKRNVRERERESIRGMTSRRRPDLNPKLHMDRQPTAARITGTYWVYR